MKSRTSKLWGLGLALMLIAAACSSSSDDSPDAASGDSTDQAAGGGLSGDIRVWTHQNDAFNGGLQDLADGFTTANPDVSIEFETFDYDTYIQTLQTALPAGNEADILQVFGSWTCSYADNLATVPSSLIETGAARDAFFGASIDGYVCGDQLYGLPQEFNIEYGATLVNTQLAEEAGISDITSGWADWDAFAADALTLTDGEADAMLRAGYNFTSGDALPYTFYSMIVQLGGSYLAEDGTFTINTEEGRAALEQMLSLVEAGVVDPVLYNDESNWVGDCFFETTCAMGLVGPWVIADYAGDFPDVAAATSYVPLPSLGDAPDFVADSGWGLTVSSRSEVQDAAWAFVEYVTLNQDNALGWNITAGTLPALKSNAEGVQADRLVAEFPHFAPFLDLLPFGQFVGQLPDRDLLWYDITYPHVLNALQGTETVGEALSAMEREANE